MKYIIFLCVCFLYISWNSVCFGQDNTVATTSTVSMAEKSALYTHIVINEILPVPAEGEKEWIELYNASSSTIDLSGVSIKDEIGVIATTTQQIAPFGYIVIELTKSVLNNTGDGIFLFDQENLVASVVYGNAKTEQRDIASVPALGQSIMRRDNGVYVIADTPTKGEKNSSATQESVTSTSTSHVVVAAVAKGTVLINEFVSDPADHAEEFIELSNISEETIDLTGWFIEDSSETKTVLTGMIAPKGFFVIEKPKGALNNTGDEIILYTTTHEEIDRVAYGSIDDGNIQDNAPAAKDPWSVARTQSRGNNVHDFVVTTHVTKGAVNIIHSPIIPKEITETPEEIQDKRVIITEIFPNPKGSDTEREFIELKNMSSEPVDLSGWNIGDSSKTRFSLGSLSIMPGAYVIFYRKDTRISLNNSGTDSVRLFTASGALADSVSYEGGVEEETTYARNTDGIFLWTSEQTPGSDNVIQKKNHLPDVVIALPKKSTVGENILFDASDTSDQDQDALSFSWFMNDEHIAEGVTAEYIFQEPGKYRVSVSVTDGVNSPVIEKKNITISPSEKQETLQLANFSESIQLSEIFPDPEGSDTEDEFIELYNAGEYEVDLTGWFLDDAEGGSRPFQIPDGTMIGPHQYIIFERHTTRIALNNTEESVRLLFPDKTVAEEVVLSDVQEQASYIKLATSSWMWSAEPTPGEINKETAITPTDTKKKTVRKDGKIVTKASIGHIAEFEAGDMVMVQGTVAVKPGIFSPSVFYLVDKSGVQISIPKKQLPAIDVGDVIEISGVVGEVKGEKRISVKKKEDIRIVRPGVAPEVAQKEIGLLAEEDVGSLVGIEGEILEKKAASMFIDDGTGEIAVVFPKSVKTNDMNVGDIIRVAGIMRTKEQELYVMPRMMEDVQKIGVASSTIDMPVDIFEEKKSYVQYIYITSGAVGILGIASYLRKRKRTVQ